MKLDLLCPNSGRAPERLEPEEEEEAIKDEIESSPPKNKEDK